MHPPRPQVVELPVKRGLSRPEAAGYIGVSPSTFDKMIAVGKMPKPIHVGTRNIWDRVALNRAFDALTGNDSAETNEWDEVLK